MYLYSLKDYRAIKSAQIRINGITVLAGVNGCGKSTLSRWLYFLINAEHEFEFSQRKFFVQSLEMEVEKIQRVFRSTLSTSRYSSIRRQLHQLALKEDNDWDNLKELYFSFVRKAEEDLSNYSKEHELNGRIAAYLFDSDDYNQLESSEIIKRYIEDCENTYVKGYEGLLHSLEMYARKDLEKVVRLEYSGGEPIPSSLSLFEDKMSLIGEEQFIPPLLLQRAIYIDTPMAVFSNSIFFVKNIWSQFEKYITTVNNDYVGQNSSKLKLQIQSVIGGSFKEVDDEFEVEKELHYVSKEQGVDIAINEAATGIKTFAYMYKLIENGWLDKYSLLLIDEPEAHLHPQWIVEFARLLVLIHKELGVKVLIASHNPDMIAAIQAIATKEDVIDDTVFYLAQKDMESGRFIFEDKESEIGDIFESFNIALSRIEMYGTSSL